MTAPWAWRPIVHRLRASSKIKCVLFALADYGDRDGKGIYPGRYRLAIECDVSRATVTRALRLGLKIGLLEVRRGNRRRGQADEYRLTEDGDAIERAAANGTPILTEDDIKRMAADAARADAERDAKARHSRLTHEP